MSYSLRHFGYMINDPVRVAAYHEALRRTVQPGSVVVDIGAGTGIFSLVACQLGARRVYAIETLGVVAMGPEIAKLNGYDDRIEFIHANSTSVNLPELADVVVTDLRGQIPLFGQIIPTLADAQRFLKPGGVLLPQQDTVYAALVHAPKAYQQAVLTPWVNNRFSLDMQPASQVLVNTPVNESTLSDDMQVILPPQVWVQLNYTTRTDPNADATLEWEVDTASTLHFITLWFDAVLVDDIGYSNAPGGTGPQVYGRLLFPLEKPLDIQPGDRLTVRLRANLHGYDYIYSWETVLRAQDGAVKARFQQSTFYSTPMQGLSKRAPSFKPHLKSHGEATLFILNAIKAGGSIQTIAEAVRAAFPELFPTYQSALSQVADLSQSYSK